MSRNYVKNIPQSKAQTFNSIFAAFKVCKKNTLINTIVIHIREHKDRGQEESKIEKKNRT